MVVGLRLLSVSGTGEVRSHGFHSSDFRVTGGDPSLDLRV